MVSTSGNPPTHITVRDGSEETQKDEVKNVQTLEVGSAQKAATAKVAQKAEMDAAKAARKAEKAHEWRQTLPQWLRENEPVDHGSFYWNQWFVYAHTLNSKAGAKLPVPKLVDYVEGCRQNTAYVRSHNQHSMCRVCVLSAAGGQGKTTTSILLAIADRLGLEMPVLLFDADNSRPNVFNVLQLEKEGAMTGHALAERMRTGWIPTHDDIARLATFDYDSNVLAIHALNKRVDDATSRMILERLKPAVHTIITDARPGNEETDIGVQGIVEASDIVIVSGDGSSSNGIDSIKTTLDWPAFELRSPGKKAGNVIVAVTKVKPSDVNSRTQYEMAERFGLNAKQVVLFPLSSYIRGSGKLDQSNKIVLNALDTQMRYSISCLSRIQTEMAIRINRPRSSRHSGEDIQSESIASDNQEFEVNESISIPSSFSTV